ncbi:glutathione ABC transporter permease GsiC [Mesorhizobium sp. L-8-10]|uniref:ABC transporter permease n=1 Tax=unclassified Mesorhizobium TaxID=325217 RepID=UPI0019274276|nr:MULTISPECIES: ABC transporter permease [unclassified Mesorhizobium]BCH27991.1 glutathione ABC transporter permease GsiC [Mesorhizobium sp. L-8-3]BCH35864.1 glutathione ABC transporter permease GsiC [Mesorhizobium sp. L-8-10]
MLRFLVKRFATIPLVVLGVVTILFVIFKSVPGDEASFVAGATATQAEIEAVRVQLGLDRPLVQQYVGHVVGLLSGDFGFSSTFRGNPMPHILERLPATLALTASAILLTIVAGIPAGVAAAANRNRWPDYAISFVVVGLLAIPNFWLGMVLIAFLSVNLGLLPSFGAEGPLSLVIPTLALAARLIALVARMTRGVVIEELRKDYVRTARAKGMAPPLVLRRHVLRNVMIPTVTVIGLQTGYLLGGSVVVERLCAWPGIGDLMLTAVSVRDYTLIQAITLVFVVGFLFVNIAVEVIYRLVNPRLRYA